MSKQVVLVPGLWNPGAAMWLLARRLERSGYAARIFCYSGRAPYEANVERLAHFARGETLFVGHSLGGVMALDMLNRNSGIEPRALVLLGAPVRGCFAGRRFGAARLGRWMMGACRSLWEERSVRWTRAASLGVVAGTLSMGLGRAFGSLPGTNDGVVCVEETAVEGMSERALVHTGHSMLVVSATVSRLVEHFLGAGRFA